MDQQVLVGEVDGRTHVAEKPQAVLDTELVRVAIAVDRGSLDVLHDQVGLAAIGRAAFVEAGDRGMLEPGEDLPLVSKPGDFISRGDSYLRAVVKQLARARKIKLSQPWSDLPQAFRKLVMEGQDKEVDLTFRSRSRGGGTTWQMRTRWKGFFRYIEEWHGSTTSEEWGEILEGVMQRDHCHDCEGDRLEVVRELVVLVVVDAPLDVVLDHAVEHLALVHAAVQQAGDPVLAPLGGPLVDQVDPGAAHTFTERASSSRSSSSFNSATASSGIFDVPGGAWLYL